MKHAAAVTTTKPTSGSNPLTLGRLTLDFLDTAWRIAVPVALLAAGGIFADKALSSAPWLTMLGMALGFVAAGLLIKKQIAGVKFRGGAK
jgi:surface polysaccharide O-acyltransferase-like enzyme